MSDKKEVMKVYKFKVRGAGAPYTLLVQDKGLALAVIQAQTIVGEGRSVSCVMWEPGTLSGWLGEEFQDRVAARWKSRHKLAFQRKQARQKAVEDGSHT